MANTCVKQGYIEPVVSKENTISFMSEPPVADAAGLGFLLGEGDSSSFVSFLS